MAFKVNHDRNHSKNSSMRKILSYLILAFTAFFLCSCIEEYHAVKKNGDGFEIRLIYSISKSVVDITYEQEGRDVLKELKTEIYKEYGKHVHVEQERKDDAYLITASFLTNSRSSKSAKLMLPKVKGNKMTIPLDYQRQYNKENEENFSFPYFTPKYNLIVDKLTIDNLKSVQIRRKSGEAIDVDFSEDGELYIISIPLKWLYFRDPFVEAVLTTDVKECRRGFEFSAKYKNCIPICKDNEILHWRPMEEACGYRDYPDTCIRLPKHAHKVEARVTNDVGRVELVNELSWECDEGYSRHKFAYECTKWPKGAQPAKVGTVPKCWISTIDTSAVKNQFPNIQEIFWYTNPIDEYVPDSLKHAVWDFRGPLNTNIEGLLINDKSYSCERRKMNYYKVNPQYTALGPWSGCWECPRGTVYNAEKEECVKRDIQKKDVDIDVIIKDMDDRFNKSCHEVSYEQ